MLVSDPLCPPLEDDRLDDPDPVCWDPELPCWGPEALCWEPEAPCCEPLRAICAICSCSFSASRRSISCCHRDWKSCELCGCWANSCWRRASSSSFCERLVNLIAALIGGVGRLFRLVLVLLRIQFEIEQALEVAP